MSDREGGDCKNYKDPGYINLDMENWHKDADTGHAPYSSLHPERRERKRWSESTTLVGREGSSSQQRAPVTYYCAEARPVGKFRMYSSLSSPVKKTKTVVDQIKG